MLKRIVDVFLLACLFGGLAVLCFAHVSAYGSMADKNDNDVADSRFEYDTLVAIQRCYPIQQHIFDAMEDEVLTVGEVKYLRKVLEGLSKENPKECSTRGFSKVIRGSVRPGRELFL